MKLVKHVVIAAYLLSLINIQFTKGQVLAYEGFDYFLNTLPPYTVGNTAISLHNVNTNTSDTEPTSLGWRGDWQVEGNNTTGYLVDPTNSPPVSDLNGAGNVNLVTAGSYAVGGFSSTISAGRRLQTSTAGPFGTNNGVSIGTAGTDYLINNHPNANSRIGRAGTTIWMSILLRKDNNNNDPTYVSLHRNNNVWDGDAGTNIAMGYFGTSSNVVGNRRWSLRIGSIVYPSSISVATGSWTLLVVSITFGATNTVNFYAAPNGAVNSIGGTAPAANVTQLIAGDYSFNSVAYMGGNNAGQSALDEIRFGSSYAYATLSSTAIRIRGGICTGSGMNIFTSGNFGPITGTNESTIASGNWATAIVKNNVAPWNAVTNGSYSYVPNPNASPGDGSYTIANRVRNPWGIVTGSQPYWPDFVTSDGGFLMVVNASYTPGKFYEQTPNASFCGNVDYEFSVDVRNLDNTQLRTLTHKTAPPAVISSFGFRCDPATEPGCEQFSSASAPWRGGATNTSGNISANDTYRVLPDLEFLINDVVVYNPPSPIPNDGQWHRIGFRFATQSLTAGSLKLTIRNKAPGGPGNDLALDNFTFRPCLPTVAIDEDFPACTKIPTAIQSGTTIATPVYQWQVRKRNSNGTWTGTSWVDISGATSASYDPRAAGSPIEQNDSLRVKIASVTANLNSPTCVATAIGALARCTTIPLPVTLISFDAQKITTGVQLNWQTSFEKNSDYFVAERSVDGQLFVPVCQVKAQGNSSHLETYYCYDSAPAAGTNYYRLKSVDFDGQFTYSKVVTLHYDQNPANSIILNPNPAQDDVKVVFTESFDKVEEVTIRITTLAGQLLQKEHRKVDPQSRELKLSTAHLTEGMYLVEVETQNRKYIQKLIINK
jgi:hypothetical protein